MRKKVRNMKAKGIKVEGSLCNNCTIYLKGWNCHFTSRQGRSEWIRDAIDIVGPGTSFAISTLVGTAIFLVSIEVASSSTPTSILDGEKNHLPFSCNLVALIDSIASSFVVSSDSRIRAIYLGNCSSASVFPAAEMDVC